jgi:EmrB/QacA subfamily drug resistance transporter
VPEREVSLDPVTGPTDDRYGWTVFTATMIGVLLVGFNASAMTVALPSVVRDLDASPSQANWFLLAYGLFNTVFVLSYGRLTDLFGRRPLYLAGLASFAVTGLACALATSPEMLIVFRILQAIGGAAVVTNTTAILVDVFPSRSLGLALGFNLTAVSVAHVSGPVLGGLLTSALGWRAIFWVNVPLGLIAMTWAAVVIRPIPADRRGQSFDFVGAALSFAVLGGLLYSLSVGGAAGWGSPSVVAGIVVFLVALPAFVISQRRRSSPLVDLSLFAERFRTMAYLSMFLVSAIRFAVVVLVSVFFQAAAGVDAFHAGLRVAPLAVGMMLAAPVSGRLSARFAPRSLSTAGLVIVLLAGLALLVSLQPDSGYWAIAVQLGVIGFGIGVFGPPNTTSIMMTVSGSRRGIANGVRSTLQNTGNAVGTALALVIATSTLTRADRIGVYSGELNQMSDAAVGQFVTGSRITLIVIVGMCALAIAGSMLRGGRTLTTPSTSEAP